MDTFLGDTTQSDRLDETAERDLVGARGGHGMLVPYLRQNFDVEPWVLVHGIHDAPSTLKPLADAIVETVGNQVYFFFYDDSTRYLDRTGDDLARGLAELASSTKKPIRVIAHSMGGIVARAAMNSLVSPNWLPARSAMSQEPLRGAQETKRIEEPLAHVFSRLDLIAIDTPWHGFTDVDVEVRNKMEREMSYVDIVSSSTLLRSLTQVDLPPHFSINQIEADNDAAGKPQDKVLSLGELPEDAFEVLVRYFAGEKDALAGHRRLENQIRALEDEADGPRLIATLRELASTGRLDHAAFLKLTADAVPRLSGCHVSILQHPELLAEIKRTFARYQP